jgi:hypothetical protein
MGKRKSYKRRPEFKDDKEMLRLMRRYHEEVLVDLIHSDVEPYYRHHDWDHPSTQMSHISLGSGSYYLWTRFNDDGRVVHEIEKVGASNRLVRKKPMVPYRNDRAPERSDAAR